MRLLAWIVCALAVSAAGAQPPYPRSMSPQQVLDAMFEMESANPPREFLELFERVRHQPEAYAPLLSHILRLPERVEDLDNPHPELKHRLSRQGGAAGLLEYVGREHAEPILLRVFKEARPFFEQCERDAEVARIEWEERGGWAKAGSVEDRAEAIRIGRRRTYYRGRMTDMVRIASRLDSPILVDPTLEFYEAGLDDRDSGWPEYLLKFAGERPDVIPRLEKVAANPKTSHSVKFKIRRGIEAYRKSFVQREPDSPEPDQVITQAPSPAATSPEPKR
jgi:hypothetical protein